MSELIPIYSNIESDIDSEAKERAWSERHLWEAVVNQLPDGYRMVGTVDRDGGDIYDLGQNAEGQFRLFRRLVDPWLWNSHGKAEVLSDVDLAGFKLMRWQSEEDLQERASEEGEFSSLCKSNLIIL